MRPCDFATNYQKKPLSVARCLLSFSYLCVMVLLNKYKPGGHKINHSLLWEYDMNNFDWQSSKMIVAQRVIELGTPEDFYAAFDLYGGIDGFREIIKTIPHLSDIDINFVCVIFNLKREELRCCTKRQLI